MFGISPDSFFFFSEAEKLTGAKRVENEGKLSLQRITAHLSQDSVYSYLQPFSRAMQEFTLVGHTSISSGAQYSQSMKTQTERS